MAKPDLQRVYVRPDDGNLRRLDGKLGLPLAFENLATFADNSAAVSGGLAVGSVYKTSAGALRVVV